MFGPGFGPGSQTHARTRARNRFKGLHDTWLCSCGYILIIAKPQIYIRCSKNIFVKQKLVDFQFKLEIRFADAIAEEVYFCGVSFVYLFVLWKVKYNNVSTLCSHVEVFFQGEVVCLVV